MPSFEILWYGFLHFVHAFPFFVAFSVVILYYSYQDPSVDNVPEIFHAPRHRSEHTFLFSVAYPVLWDMQIVVEILASLVDSDGLV